MKACYALTAAALVLTGAADPTEIMISGDRILSVTAQGVPARLRVDPGAPTTPIFNPDFAARAEFRSGWLGFAARVGPVKVKGYTAVIRLDYGDGESKRRIGWFDGPYVDGADGGIGPGALSADRVRFVIGPAMPGERSMTFPLADFGRAGMGVYLIVNGERILTRLHFAMSKVPAKNIPTRSKVSAKGQVTIPAELREAAGIKPGTDVVFTRLPDGRVLLRAKTGKPVDFRSIAKSTVRAPDAQIRSMKAVSPKGAPAKTAAKKN
jgi:AbrB family looped-hinge helix DNA binding protein